MSQVVGAESDLHLSAAPEGGVERAVGPVADQGEVMVGAVEGGAEHHDLVVGLYSQLDWFGISRADRGGHYAVRAKARVQAAIGTVAEHAKAVGATRGHYAATDYDP